MPAFDIETSILPPTPENLGRVVSYLQNGEVVALPTETVYGLAADAFNLNAVQEIFNIKERPFSDPLILHVPTLESLLELVDVTSQNLQDLKALAEAFSPGPLTYVLPKKPSIPSIVTAGRMTVAIRIPQHPILRELMLRSNRFLAAPSANPFGYISPTSAEHVRQSLQGRLRYILDGGDCQIGLESTIIDLSQEPLRILRPGKITQADLQAVLQREVIDAHLNTPTSPESSSLAPGMLPNHYQPKTPLYLFHTQHDLPLAFNQHIARVFLSRLHAGPQDDDFFLSEEGHLEGVAKSLFGILRKIDGSHVYQKIYCQCPPAEGLGLAIADRLRRAASGEIRGGIEKKTKLLTY